MWWHNVGCKVGFVWEIVLRHCGAVPFLGKSNLWGAIFCSQPHQQHMGASAEDGVGGGWPLWGGNRGQKVGFVWEITLRNLRTVISWAKGAFGVEFFAANPINSMWVHVWRMGFGVGSLCGGKIGAERRVLYGEAIAPYGAVVTSPQNKPLRCNFLHPAPSPACERRCGRWGWGWGAFVVAKCWVKGGFCMGNSNAPLWRSTISW